MDWIYSFTTDLTKRNTVWCQIHRKSLITIQIYFDRRSRNDFFVCTIFKPKKIYIYYTYIRWENYQKLGNWKVGRFKNYEIRQKKSKNKEKGPQMVQRIYISNSLAEGIPYQNSLAQFGESLKTHQNGSKCNFWIPQTALCRMEIRMLKPF